MEQQFLRDAGGKKLGSCVVGTVPHHFSALPGRQLFSADINFPTALLLQPRQNHGKGSFSRAVSASQGGDLPGGQRKIQIFKNKELLRLQVRFRQKKCSSRRLQEPPAGKPLFP